VLTSIARAMNRYDFRSPENRFLAQVVSEYSDPVVLQLFAQLRVLYTFPTMNLETLKVGLGTYFFY